MKKILFFAAVATLFAACTKDATKDLAPAKPTDTFYVSIGEEDSRVQLNEQMQTVWTEGDRVSVFNKTTGNRRYKFTGKTGDRTGELSYMNGGTTGSTISQVVAVYPYNYANKVAFNGTITTTIPAQQTYCKGSYGIGNNIMVARSDDENLSFRNIMGWIRVSLTGTRTIKSIVLTGYNNEKIAGEATINSDMSVTMASDATQVITLDCGDGVTLSKKKQTYFYIAMPPQTFSKGVLLVITDTENLSMILKTTNEITIQRNHVVAMASSAYKGKDGVHANQLWYTTSDSKIIIPKIYNGNIISNTYTNGKGVIAFDCAQTSIGDNAFNGYKTLTSITIPDSVTKIGEYAFKDCNGLESITIPDSVMTIGDHAFYECIGLKSATIGKGVTTIGWGAFVFCKGLKSVYITDIAAWCNIKFTSGLGSASYGLYLNGTLVKDLVIPDGVTSIGDYAFNDCVSLTSVTIPASVTSIGDAPFAGCTGLASVYGPYSVSGNKCLIIDGKLVLFVPSSGLTTYDIPDDVTTIGDEAFYGCNGLTSVTIPDSVTKIGEYAFYKCTSLTSITIPDSVTSIGDAAFYDCPKMASVYITDIEAWCNIKFGDGSANPLGKNLYLNGELVTDLVIPDGVTTIGNYAFGGCKSLTSITIPDSVTSIGDSAFSGCEGLTRIDIPARVKRIGDYAFGYCKNLQYVHCYPTTPPSLGRHAFYNIASYATIYVPAKSGQSYKYNWSEYASKIVAV